MTTDRQDRNYGAGGETGTIAANINTDGGPHAPSRRLEPVSRSVPAGRYACRRHRDEPIELARRSDRAGGRSPAAQEDRAGRDGAAAPSTSLARRGDPERSHHRPDHRRVRGRPRRVLAGAMVDRTRHRGPRHSSDQRRGVARAQAGQDGQARHGDADTRVHRMAARRTRALWHGRRPDDRGRGCQTPEPGAREPGRGAHAHRQSAEGGPGAARHSRVQTGATPGCAASGNAANSRGPAEFLRTCSTRCGAISPGSR